MNIPQTVRDRASWCSLKELDEIGENLTAWEIDFVESLTRQLLMGRHLSQNQVARLDAIREDRLP